MKTTFRIALIYFFVQAFPLDWKYYKTIFNTNWTELHFQDMFRLTTYSPVFISPESISAWGIGSFANWGIALAIAVVAGIAWSILDKKNKDYDLLYYYVRVVLRFRLAIGIIGYGMLKLFKLQLPGPTLSDLHTSYGDYLPWKIYYLSTGIGSAFYEQSIGTIEILAGLLLLFRKTTTIGTSIIIFVLTNIVIANFAYEIGAHVYSAYLLSLAFFLLSYDLPRLYKVFVKREFTRAASFKVVFLKTWLYPLRIGLKVAVAIFIVLYGFKTYAGLHEENWPFPKTAGLHNAYGYYNVSEFEINHQALPYSLTDSVRWNNVVFEPWNTVSIKTNTPAEIDFTSPSMEYGAESNYESAGNAGRHFYAYQLDTLSGKIQLASKNRPAERLDFQYVRLDSTTIILSGKNLRNDSLRIVLTKMDRKYLLHEGRRKPIKIN